MKIMRLHPAMSVIMYKKIPAYPSILINTL